MKNDSNGYLPSNAEEIKAAICRVTDYLMDRDWSITHGAPPPDSEQYLKDIQLLAAWWESPNQPS